MTTSVPVNSRKRPFFRWMRYLLTGFLSLLIALAFAGAMYEGIESHRDRRLYHPPGRLVDIGGDLLPPPFCGAGSPPLLPAAGRRGRWAFSRTAHPPAAGLDP